MATTSKTPNVDTSPRASQLDSIQTPVLKQLVSAALAAAEQADQAVSPALTLRNPAAQNTAAVPHYLEIDLDQLAANARTFKALLTAAAVIDPQPLASPAGASAVTQPAVPQRRPARLCAVIKADAYGLGAVPIARRLEQAGADMLAVYNAQQAAHILGAGTQLPVLCFMPVHDLPDNEALHQAVRNRQLHLSVYQPSQLADLDRLGQRLQAPVQVHLFYDSGMTRGGLDQPHLAKVLDRLADFPHIQVTGLYTHFAAADEEPDFAHRQLKDFLDVVARSRPALPREVTVHAANTFATLRDPAFHLDMVRVGLGLHGVGPELMAENESTLLTQLQQAAKNGTGPISSLRPCLRWVSQITHIHDAPTGRRVGYNGTFTLQRDSRLGLIPVGYADGYPLTASNQGAAVLVKTAANDGHPTAVPVLGKVNMDQLIIDLTALPQAAINDTVEVISNHPGSVASLARLTQAAGSSCYETLTRLSPRIPRSYLGDTATATS